MSATFYERVLRIGDWENDGGAVDLPVFSAMLTAYEANEISASDLKTFHTSETTPGSLDAQKSDIQDILDTRPAYTSVAVQIVPPGFTDMPGAARARWALYIGNACYLAQQGISGWETEENLKNKLGI